MAGTLYIVATPIGHLDDLSQRAMQILHAVDRIAAEDTRHSRRLLDHFGIKTTCYSLHEHNEQQRTEQVLQELEQGLSIALISDAGTPLISDPGYRLVQQAQAHHIKIVPIPGPCALITALSAAGLPTDRFLFEGFLPSKSTARKKNLQALLDEKRTIIFYESPHRIVDTIEDMMNVFGEQRYTVVARELTKTFETIKGGTLAEIKTWLAHDRDQQKGEFVILIHGAEENSNNDQQRALQVLDILINELPISQAVKLAAKITGKNKSWLYEIALKRQKL